MLEFLTGFLWGRALSQQPREIEVHAVDTSKHSLLRKLIYIKLGIMFCICFLYCCVGVVAMGFFEIYPVPLMNIAGAGVIVCGVLFNWFFYL